MALGLVGRVAPSRADCRLRRIIGAEESIGARRSDALYRIGPWTDAASLSVPTIRWWCRAMEMISPRRLSYFLLASFACGICLVADEVEELQCRQAHGFAPIDASDHRKYAPDRKVDILNLALDVTPDFKARSIQGKATLTFKPIAKALSELELDAVDLTVESVTSSETVQAFQATDQKLIVTFAAPLRADQETSVTIVYSAHPRKGLYFRTPEMGYKGGDTHLFTQGEATEARHWYPCFDSPNEKFTSEITCRAPEGMVVRSNGRLISETKDAGGLMATHWRQDKPHVNYLMSLVAGYFKQVEDVYRDIPLAFFTPPSRSTRRLAHSATRGTRWLSSRRKSASRIPGRNTTRCASTILSRVEWKIRASQPSPIRPCSARRVRTSTAARA